MTFETKKKKTTYIFSNVLRLKICLQVQTSCSYGDKVKQTFHEDHGASKGGGPVPSQLPQESFKRVQIRGK